MGHLPLASPQAFDQVSKWSTWEASGECKNIKPTQEGFAIGSMPRQHPDVLVDSELLHKS